MISIQDLAYLNGSSKPSKGGPRREETRCSPSHHMYANAPDTRQRLEKPHVRQCQSYRREFTRI